MVTETIKQVTSAIRNSKYKPPKSRTALFFKRMCSKTNLSYKTIYMVYISCEKNVYKGAKVKLFK